MERLAPPNASGKVVAYADGSLSVDPDLIRDQYLYQFMQNARSNLEEDEWREKLIAHRA